MKNNDPFGNACIAYLKGIRGLEIKVKSDHAEDDTIPVDYLFRTYQEMPLIEQTALNLCKGKVLDIGAGAGCHSKWLNKNGFQTSSIDKSIGACKAMKAQNINAQHVDFYNYSEKEKFDTLLALMNGTGISGNIEHFASFLNKCKDLLSPNGQLLIDSSDIIYLFENEKELKAHTNGKYYGQVKYQMVFDGAKTEWFDWIYLSFEKLHELSSQNGFNCELVIEGNHYDYLAKLTVK